MSEPISVPRSAFVCCPQNKFAHTRVDKCPACPYFSGLVDAKGKGEFDDRYYVQCSAPMTRRIHSIEVD